MKNLLWRRNMSDNFKYSEWRKNENIKRYEIPNVENYFEDLMTKLVAIRKTINQF